MKLAGRAAAAVEILREIEDRHRPASEALKDWGKAHRFAGSGDRHAIGTLVYDCLRSRNSLAARMADDRARSLVLAALHDGWGLSADGIDQLSGEPHGLGSLTEQERQSLSQPLPQNAPVHIAGNIPAWLEPAFVQTFGDAAAAEGAALARRAPVDLRVNSLKATRPDVIAALARFGAGEGPWSPLCVRIAAPGPDIRNANVEAEPAHGMGWYEVQDAASQVAALMAGVKPGDDVADICAGAGGKTLALAAMMENRGTLIAHDRDRFRLRPIFERLTRAGVSNCEVISAQETGRLASRGPYDCVVVDAPCSGSGAWRRKPDGKWRLTPKQLEQRLKDQAQVLEQGYELTRPGGRLVYITCSVLEPENAGQIAAFLGRHRDVTIIPYTEQWQQAMAGPPPLSADGGSSALLLTPARHDTDGFFVAVMSRA